MKPHIRYIVEGQIRGSQLIGAGVTVDKDGDPIERDETYDYTVEQADSTRTWIISKPNKFKKP